MSWFDYSELLDTVAYGGIKSLSPIQTTIAITAVSYLLDRRKWLYNNKLINDSLWDALENDISACLDNLMLNSVGLIFPSVFSSSANANYLLCDGAVYQKSDYPILYDAIDNVYIIDSLSFRVPDLQDCFVMGASGVSNIGDTGGAKTVTLSIDEIPSHSHNYNQPTFGVDIESVGVPDPTGVGNPPLTSVTSSTGGGQAHDNLPPYHTLSYFIVAK